MTDLSYRQRIATPEEDAWSREHEERLIALCAQMGVTCTEPWVHLSRRGHLELHFGPGRTATLTGSEITASCSILPWAGEDLLAPAWNYFSVHLGEIDPPSSLEEWISRAEERVSTHIPQT